MIDGAPDIARHRAAGRAGHRRVPRRRSGSAAAWSPCTCAPAWRPAPTRTPPRSCWARPTSRWTRPRTARTSRWRRYEASLHAEVLERMQLRTDLDRALADDEFLLHFQPIVSLGSTGATVGFEALLRWPHPTRGMVPPDAVHPDRRGVRADRSARRVGAAHAAIEAAARLAPAEPRASAVHQRQRLGPAVPHAGVRGAGASPRCSKYRAAAGAAQRWRSPRACCCGDEGEIQADLARLRQAGIKVVDRRLRHRLLLAELPAPRRGRRAEARQVLRGHHRPRRASSSTWSRGIIQLADTLALEVVAEGVETVAEHHLLADAGCALGQGYLFARPMPETDARERIVGETGVHE